MKSILLLCAVLLACTASADRKEAANMVEHKPSDLEARLVAAGYDGLFLSGDRSRADAIWEQGKNQSALQAIDNIAVPLQPDHAARDAEIETLEAALAARVKR